MRLPPPGSPEATPQALAEYVNQLYQEAGEDQRRIDWQTDAERSFNLYIGNHFTTATPEGMIRIVLNRVLNIVMSNVAIQAGDPPKITFTGRESGDTPITFLNTDLPEAATFVAQLVSEGIDPRKELQPITVTRIQQQIDTSQLVVAKAQAMGEGVPQGAALPSNLLVEVNDHTKAEAIQTIFDGDWEDAGCAYTFVENIFNKNVVGWQPTYYEFDDDTKSHILTNVHPFQVFVDPLKTDRRKQHYNLFDDPIPEDEAIARWPDLADKIKADSTEGQIHWPGNRIYMPADMYLQNFRRHMTVIRSAWIQFQPYPMSTKQALAKGKIEARPVPLGYEDLAFNDDGSQQFDQLGTAVTKPATRPGYFAPGVDGEIDNSHPNWPVRFGIRQLTVVANECVDDRECEHEHFPMVPNRNVPIPYSPYGMGEPKRLEGLQMAIDRCVSYAVTNMAYNAFPVEVMRKELADKLDVVLKGARTKPGQRIAIPKDALPPEQDLEKAIVWLKSAEMPTDLWKFLDLLLSMIDREGNQADVIQGNAAPGWSGEAIASLQNAASQVIKAKSMFTEFWLKDIAKLMVHSIVNRMSVDDWKSRCGHLPYQAIQAMHDQRKSLGIDIKVEIASGSGAAKQSETNNLVAARAAGVPVSDPTLIDRLGLDIDTELQKQAQYLRKRANLLPAAPQTNTSTTAGDGGAELTPAA